MALDQIDDALSCIRPTYAVGRDGHLLQTPAVGDEASHFGGEPRPVELLVGYNDRWSWAPGQLELLESVKAKAKEAGLWNFFLPDAETGEGLKVPLAEVEALGQADMEKNLEQLVQIAESISTGRGVAGVVGPTIEADARSRFLDKIAREMELSRAAVHPLFIG